MYLELLIYNQPGNIFWILSFAGDHIKICASFNINFENFWLMY